MFLRRHTKLINGTDYSYWSLVKTVRTPKGPRHQLVAHLGKLDADQIHASNAWPDLDALLAGKAPPSQLALGESMPPAPQPLWRTVDISGVRVENVRQFGRVYLTLALWRRLGLDKLLSKLLPAGAQDVGWDLVACVLTIARFCEQPSELCVAERWYADTALEDLLGVGAEKINDARLYRGLDALLAQKEALSWHLLERYQSWFGTRFEFLIYDVTSTYFEGLAEDNELAARGYSRDHRPDCQQVCIGLVVTPEGLPVGYEVFAGNRTDVTTVQEMVTVMEEKYGKAGRVWAGVRVGGQGEEGEDGVGAAGAWGVFIADERGGVGRGTVLEVVRTTDAGRGSVSGAEERFGIAAGVSPEDGSGAGAHLGVFSGVVAVAGVGAMDGEQRDGQLLSATAEGTGRVADDGRGVADGHGC